MDEAEQIVLQLAKTYEKPDEFLHQVENLFDVSASAKGSLFFHLVQR